MSIDPRELRNVMGHFATGVTIITTKDKTGKPFGLTANAFSSLSLAPPLVLVCVDKTVDCYACFEDSKVFAVNFLSEEQEQLRRASQEARRFCPAAGREDAGRSGGLRHVQSGFDIG